MADNLTDEEKMIQKEMERRRRFSRGADTGVVASTPKPDMEADQGAPKSGWRNVLTNMYDSLTNAPIKKGK